MSFESARKMGLAASLISVIIPAVAGILYIGLLVSILSAVSAIRTGTTGLFTSALFVNAMLPVMVALAAVAIAGYILFLIAMYRFSKYYNEPAIFKNLLYALIIQIIAAIVISVGVFAFTFSAAASTLQNPTPTTSVSTVFFSIIILVLVLLIVAVVIGIVCALLYKRSFDRLAEKSGVDNFKTAGLLYLIGVVLTVIGIGGIIIWIAWIFAALGYHKLAPTASSTYSSPIVVAPFVAGATKRCPVCGAENPSESVYCGRCGKQL